MSRIEEELRTRIAALESDGREKEATIARLLKSGQDREERYHGLVALNADLMHRVERHHLTGLYNKTAFEARVTEFITQMARYRSHTGRKRKADESGPPHGVFVLFDLNGFKFVNDIIGHIAGDEILMRIAQFLGYRFKHDSRDIVGHLGGDEFALLLNSIDIETAQTIIERDVLPAIRGVRPTGLDMQQFGQRMKRDYVVSTAYGLVAVDDPGISYAVLMNLAENQMEKLADRRKDYIGR
jgi:diguanylate cyclase (GGDEF)-like protein